MQTIGRKCEIINLDFANDHIPYNPSADVRDMMKLEDVMEEYSLGPNGGLVFCMESLLENVEWLEESIIETDSQYIIFDCPGQVY